MYSISSQPPYGYVVAAIHMCSTGHMWVTYSVCSDTPRDGELGGLLVIVGRAPVIFYWMMTETALD